MKDIGKNIRILREQKGLTQEELAGRLFVTRQTLSNYETGRTRPDLDMLEKLSQELNQALTTLIYGPPHTETQKRQRRRLLWGAILTLAALGLLLLAHCLDRAEVTYNVGPRVVAAMVCQPLFWLLLGWTLLQGVFLMTHSRPLSGRWVQPVRWGLLGLLAVYVLLVAPALAAFAFHIDFPSSLGTTLYYLLMHLSLFLIRYSFIFSLLGGSLGLCVFLTCRDSAPAEERTDR